MCILLASHCSLHYTCRKRRTGATGDSCADASFAKPRHLSYLHSTTLNYISPYTPQFTHNMNQFAERFAKNSAEKEIQKAKELFGDEDDGSDIMWGSQAGYGSLARGVPKFMVPDVPDVRTSIPHCSVSKD